LFGRFVKHKVYIKGSMLGRSTWVRIAFAVWAAALATAPGSAAAADPHELRVDVPVDVGIVVGGGVLWVTSELLKDAFAPPACRWCEVPGFDASLRERLRASDIRSPDTASNVVGFIAMPLATFGTTALASEAEGRGKNFPTDALVILEAAIVAADVNQLTKFLVGRERPFVHALPDDEKAKTFQPADNNLSFFSGHTTLAFTLATASGTVASMRHYDVAPGVWTVGMSLAVLTGYLRVAADKHHFSDVVSGAVLGSAIGFFLPFVFHRPSPGAASATTTSVASPLATPLSGANFSGTF
jgi:membrane-associated phospholipid phosphatase